MTSRNPPTAPQERISKAYSLRFSTDWDYYAALLHPSLRRITALVWGRDGGHCQRANLISRFCHDNDLQFCIHLL